jgi:hypothetical protein
MVQDTVVTDSTTVDSTMQHCQNELLQAQVIKLPIPSKVNLHCQNNKMETYRTNGKPVNTTGKDFLHQS